MNEQTEPAAENSAPAKPVVPTKGDATKVIIDGSSIASRPSFEVATIETWFAETFPGSVVSRDTEVWNFVMKAKSDLIKRLTQEN